MNKLKIRLDGLNSSGVIEYLVNNGAIVENLKIKNRTTIFEINEKDKDLLKRACKIYHRKYKIISQSGVKNFFMLTPKYFGSFLAIIIVFIFVLSYNLFIYEVNVVCEGNKNFNTENVKQILIENKISAGEKRENLNIEKIQRTILEKNNDIAGCVVKRNGGKIDVIIYPSESKISPKKDDVISNYNAVIKSVEIYSGKANVKAGDIVKEGDILIYNNNGASGKIIAKVYYSDYVIYNEKQVMVEKTGNVEYKINANLFGFYLIKQQNDSKFTKYIEENCVFYLSKNFFLPIRINKNAIYEVEYEEIVVPFASNQEKIKGELKKRVMEKIEDKNMVTNVTYSVVDENGLFRVDCFIECEIDLAK